MAETTVRELADVVRIPVNRLLAQLGECGLPHTEADQRINDQEKDQLLDHLRRLHGKSGGETAAPRKIALKRKSVSELKVASSQGRRKTVTVETRRRRSYPSGAAAKDDSGAVATGEEGTAKARMDAAKAVKATAHQLARLIYAMLTKGEEHVARDLAAWEEERRDRMVANLQRQARRFDLDLVPANT